MTKLTPAQAELLKELQECGDMVYAINYDAKQVALLWELQKLGLVELAWVTTVQGKREKV